MDKQFLIQCLQKGMSTREIEALPNVTMKRSTISYWIKKWDLDNYMKYRKPIYINNYFNTIDTKEKAYILGYTLADGYINNSTIEYGCEIADKEILDFISSEIGAKVQEDLVCNPKQRRFPRARITIGNKFLVNDINKLSGGTKENKTFPRIKKELERYMLLGFFDGDGCLTWGYRKDRNRIWQKVNFTGSYKLLFAIQKHLTKLGIVSALRPKSNENCFVLELSSKKDVLQVLSYIYGKEDLIVLRRKYNKYNALRLELGEFEETIRNTTSSQATDHSVEGVETTGGKMSFLNNQHERLSLEIGKK